MTRATLCHHLALVTLLTLAAGCDGQEIQSGSAGGSGGSTGSGGGSTGGGGSGGTGGAGGAHPGLADVQVVHGADSATVDVATLATQIYKGAAVVPLTSVWAAGKLHDDVSTLQFDFEGDDGFHPSNKASCAAFITAEQLPFGYILPESRSLVWDDTLGLPGCYGVKATAKMIGLEAPQ